MSAWADAPAGAGGERAASHGAWRAAGGFAVTGAGALALATIVVVSAASVVAAAERPSFLSPPGARGLPRWMAGPLAGLWPSLPSDVTRLATLFAISIGVLTVAWLIVLAAARRLPLWAIASTVVGTHVLFLLSPPLRLTDVFNYLVYGRMGALHGLNPYADVPAAAMHDPAYAFSNWHHLPSPYGPLFTLATYPLAPLGVSTGFWAVKLLVAAASLATIALVGWCARRVGADQRRAIVLTGLCPLVLVYELGGAHNDPLMMVCVVGAVALVLAGRDALAGAAIVAAAGVKPWAALLVPLLVLGAGNRRAALAGAAGAGAAVGLLVLVAFGGHLPATGIQSRLVAPANIPGFATLTFADSVVTPVVRHGGQLLVAATTAAAIVVVWRRRERMLAAMGAVTVVYILTATWVMPWYVAWLLPFAALARRRWLVAAAIGLTALLAVVAMPQTSYYQHLWHPGAYGSPAAKANHELLLRTLR